MLALGGAAALGACAPVDLLNATVPTRALRIDRGIGYATGALASHPRCRLDVYRRRDLPSGAPLVLFCYGGAWQAGRREDYLFVAAALARLGAVVVVPDYRLYPEVTYPAFIADVAAATVFAVRAAAGWGADPRRLFLVGHSAGAYIVAMLALDPTYLQESGADRAMLRGVVGLSGPYDFRPITRPDIRAVFAAAADTDAAQPISHVDGRNPPMLLLAGEADGTVLPANTTSLAARIRAAGGTVATRLYPGVGHVGTVAAFAPVLRGSPPVVADVARFMGLGSAER